MALHEPNLATHVLGDENLLAVIIENLDTPPTLFNLALALPVTRAVLERCPEQVLTATLSSLSSETRVLAFLYIALKQDHLTRSSMVPLLWSFLSHDYVSGSVVPTFPAIDLTIPNNLSDPFETLRKLAAVWSAIEELASGFVNHSISFIQDCKAAEATDLEPLLYHRGRKLRPLSHLWNRGIKIAGLRGYAEMDHPHPWSLPLKACEIWRVKMALWRLEIFAAISYDPCTFPNEGAIDSGTAKIYHTDPIEIPDMPHDYDEGTRILLASLRVSDLGELESVYDYLWRETIGKVYHHKIDPYISCIDELPEQEGVRSTAGIEQIQYEHDSFLALSAMNRNVVRAKMDYDRYLAYFMSRGLPFLQRMHQQLVRDGGKVVPGNYPPMRYRCLKGLRDIWNDMDTSRNSDICRSYGKRLTHINADKSVTRLGPAYGIAGDTYCALYLHTRSSNDFFIQDLWRAGCFFWERGWGREWDRSL